MVGVLRYRGTGIAPVTTNGSPETPPSLGLAPAKIIPLVLGMEWKR